VQQEFRDYSAQLKAMDKAREENPITMFSRSGAADGRPAAR
jgi:hypothetical protein